MNNQDKPKSGLVKFLEEKGFYIILFLCVIAIGISGYVLLFSGSETPEDQYLSDDSIYSDDYSDVYGSERGDGWPVDDTLSGDNDMVVPAVTPSVIESNPGITPHPTYDPSKYPTATPTPKPTPKPSSKPTMALASVFVKPVPGKVLQEYSGNELVYSKTMRDWRTHNGIDFAATDGEKVYAVADGIVEDIYEDNLLGTCVVVNHGGDVRSYYCGLMTNVVVLKDAEIKMGAVIGGVSAAAAYETLEPTHLHFEMTFKGEYVNPFDYIK